MSVPVLLASEARTVNQMVCFRLNVESSQPLISSFIEYMKVFITGLAYIITKWSKVSPSMRIADAFLEITWSELWFNMHLLCVLSLLFSSSVTLSFHVLLEKAHLLKQRKKYVSLINHCKYNTILNDTEFQ